MGFSPDLPRSPFGGRSAYPVLHKHHPDLHPHIGDEGLTSPRKMPFLHVNKRRTYAMHSHCFTSMRNAETSLDAKGGSGPKLVSFAPKQREMQASIVPESLLKCGFHELLGTGPGDECASLGLALRASWEACLSAGKSLCIGMLASEVQERGRLYGHGLAALGIAAERIVMVTAAREKDLLWALEEALTSGAFGAVIGVLGKEERLYAFPQSRRLKLRSAETATPLLLLRHWQSGGATAANGRWRVTALPSRSPGKHGGFSFPGTVPSAIASGAHGQPSPSKLGDRIRCNASSPYGCPSGARTGWYGDEIFSLI